MKAPSALLTLPLLMLLPWAGTGARHAEVPAAAPPRLSETGLYGRNGAIAPGLRAFAPQYPLWSDGAAKSRWIRLPAGTRIDTREGGNWGFPVGTKFWKEFRIAGRKVETRFLWRAGTSRWIFASYRWRPDQLEADLAPAEGLAAVADLGNGRTHAIPSQADCRACHLNGGSPVLGFNALQLSDDRDPHAPHAEALHPGMATLASLQAERLLSPARPEWTTAPPRIPAPDATTRAALGYLATNCGTCHRTADAGTVLPTVDLAFNHRLAAAAAEDEPGWATTVGRRGAYVPPGEGGPHARITPGDPARSTVLHRMASRRPATQMPPLGSVLVDEAALALLRRWIAGMAPERR